MARRGALTSPRRGAIQPAPTGGSMPTLDDPREHHSIEIPVPQLYALREHARHAPDF
jgi:hypothetical protein